MQKNKKQLEKVDEASKNNPDVPPEIFDIEASDEIADMWRDMFGQ